MVTLILRQGETGKQVLLSFPTTTPAEKEDVDRTLETLKSMSKTVTIQGAASEVMNLGKYLHGVSCNGHSAFLFSEKFIPQPVPGRS